MRREIFVTVVQLQYTVITLPLETLRADYGPAKLNEWGALQAGCGSLRP